MKKNFAISNKTYFTYFVVFSCSLLLFSVCFSCYVLANTKGFYLKDSEVALTVKTKSQSVNAKESLELQITIKNNRSDSIYLGSRIDDELFGYRVEIRNSKGLIVPLNKYQQNDNGFSSNTVNEVPAGEELIHSIKLNNLSNLATGNYSIVIIRNFIVKGEDNRKKQMHTQSKPINIQIK